jgi:hypothetical protein
VCGGTIANARSKEAKFHHDCLPKFHLFENEQVEFCPDQLVARIRVKWNEEFDIG